jgi:hypothetical protein
MVAQELTADGKVSGIVIRSIESNAVHFSNRVGFGALIAVPNLTSLKSKDIQK